MPGKNPPRGAKRSEGTWDLEDIRQLIDLLTEREISEFEMEKGGVRVRIKRGDTHDRGSDLARISSPTSSPLSPVRPEPAADLATPSASPPAVDSSTAESTEGLFIIKSPMVGTYYPSPAPNAPPFVKQGDVVQVGQVLCIIEAMKLMNEIESEVSGEIVRLYIENGQPVEYGQSLFAIKPSHKK